MNADDKELQPEAPGPQTPTNVDARVAVDDGSISAKDADSEDTEPIVLSPGDAKIRELEEALAAAKRQADDSAARLRAVSKAYTDLQSENKAFRERQEARAKQDAERRAFEQAKAFFDPVMNLKRSLQSSDGAFADEGVAAGLRMVHQQFMDALTKLGLEPVPGQGAPFDPNLHEALGVTPVTDPALDGRVLEVHTEGYAVRGRVLQAAQVLVGKLMEAEGEA